MSFIGLKSSKNKSKYNEKNKEKKLKKSNRHLMQQIIYSTTHSNLKSIFIIFVK